MVSDKGDLLYAREKFGLSVGILATTHGTLQERLLNAYMSEGHHALPMGIQAGLPMSGELIERLKAFDERMSRQPAKAGEGAFAATILSMTDEEASDAARELLEISYQVDRELEDAT